MGVLGTHMSDDECNLICVIDKCVICCAEYKSYQNGYHSKAIGQVDALADEVIRQRRKLGPSSSNSDLLSRFMGSVDDDRYLRDIVVSFLLAGRDTVASGLTTLILLLSDHPEVVAKMRREIHANLKGNSMSYEALRFPQTSSRTVPR
ncbi:uncharacterized protein A4U43_C02F8440 [Asparagus officinalis]|uniref:noroxomaritidine synthase n=1 Tax=Asparagus officinalis TaxID=4686 RepID=A0A5P1FHN3_ASPOF|nr:uncharacterized protein A4U43_C02F8440 [Asparagus officinalis]